MEDFRNLRQQGPGQADLPNEETVDLGGIEEAVKDASILQVELSDGSVSINFAPHIKKEAGDDDEHEENLALHIRSEEHTSELQ